MSKNIDEIDRVVESVLPKQVYETVDDLNNGDQCERALYGYDFAQSQLKQALTEKKLIRPLSEEAIEKIIGDIHYDLLGTGTPNGKFHSKCAKAIYERQFKEEL